MNQPETPVTPPAVTTSKPVAPPQRIEWAAVRESAYATVAARVRDLQNLEKVSKGRGVPSLHELVELARSVATVLVAIPKETQRMGESLATLWVQMSLRLEAVISVLEEKGLVEKGAIQAKMSTILEDQKAIHQKKQGETLEKSLEQVKKAE